MIAANEIPARKIASATVVRAEDLKAYWTVRVHRACAAIEPATASKVPPKFVSRSDSAAQWTGAMKGHAFFAYATNYLIDLDHAVIVDVEASRAIRQAEVGVARTMVARTQDRFGPWPARPAADSAYGSAEHIA